jgi:hypothetical protein
MLEQLTNARAPDDWSFIGARIVSGTLWVVMACPGAFPYATGRLSDDGKPMDVERHSTQQTAWQRVIDDV